MPDQKMRRPIQLTEGPIQDVIAELIDKIRAYDELTADELGAAAVALAITETGTASDLASLLVVHILRAAREPDWRRIALRCWELGGRDEIGQGLEPGQLGALRAAADAERGTRP